VLIRRIRGAQRMQFLEFRTQRSGEQRALCKEQDERAGVIRVLSAAMAVLLIAATSLETVQGAGTVLPRRLETYLTRDVKLSAAERKQLTDGVPVTKLLDADEAEEVAVFGAVWIDAPARRYVELVEDIENFEQGRSFKVTRRISTPPRLEDFAELYLPEHDVEALRTCRVGHCKVKLGEEALQRFRTDVDWKAAEPAAAADALMRELVLEYVTGYLAGGNERLAIYRDNSRPTFVAREFSEMIDQMPELTTYMPDVRRYLLRYPDVQLPDSTSFLYWQETEFGLKPTIRISHVTIREGSEETIVASKMLYATHYFWTGLELRVLFSDPSRGPGFWFVTVSRSRSDGLAGFIGRLIRRRVRSQVREGALAGLLITKRKLEGVSAGSH
jgi:hypothetical protein